MDHLNCVPSVNETGGRIFCFPMCCCLALRLDRSCSRWLVGRKEGSVRRLFVSPSLTLAYGKASFRLSASEGVGSASRSGCFAAAVTRFESCSRLFVASSSRHRCVARCLIFLCSSRPKVRASPSHACSGEHQHRFVLAVLSFVCGTQCFIPTRYFFAMLFNMRLLVVGTAPGGGLRFRFLSPIHRHSSRQPQACRHASRLPLSRRQRPCRTRHGAPASCTSYPLLPFLHSLLCPSRPTRPLPARYVFSSGPSGSGKTTLLDLLGGRKTKSAGRQEGEIIVDGVLGSGGGASSAYVMQVRNRPLRRGVARRGLVRRGA